MSKPLLSIIMLSYNAELYLNEAIESVLNQDLNNYELIIIDDGSSDNSLNIIKSFNDKRIKIHQNETNQGIVYSRNKGIRLSSGKYIGMLDSDDIALPGKFRKQVEFLEEHPDFGMVGSWALLIDKNGKLLRKKWKLSGIPDKIPSIMLFKNYFVQSSVVFRRDVLPDYLYKTGYEIVEDYKLWMDILKKAKAWNLPEYLVKYRVHGKNMTITGEKIVKDNLVAVYKELIEELGIEPTEEEIKIHHIIREGLLIQDIKTFRKAKNWLIKLLYYNSVKKIYERRSFAEMLLNRWTKMVWLSRKSNPLVAVYFLNFSIIKEYLVSRIQRNYVGF
ncbi:MAG: glycosyltransferase [Bacteroidales bacterium]|nr:glycosyltransferase [Bacteroidales bacterium]MCF8406063.1 glycosyltransferase [Bacteroidales bacterium]